MADLCARREARRRKLLVSSEERLQRIKQLNDEVKESAAVDGSVNTETDSDVPSVAQPRPPVGPKQSEDAQEGERTVAALPAEDSQEPRPNRMEAEGRPKADVSDHSNEEHLGKTSARKELESDLTKDCESTKEDVRTTKMASDGGDKSEDGVPPSSQDSGDSSCIPNDSILRNVNSSVQFRHPSQKIQTGSSESTAHSIAASSNILASSATSLSSQAAAMASLATPDAPAAAAATASLATPDAPAAAAATASLATPDAPAAAAATASLATPDAPAAAAATGSLATPDAPAAAAATASLATPDAPAAAAATASLATPDAPAAAAAGPFLTMRELCVVVVAVLMRLMLAADWLTSIHRQSIIVPFIALQVVFICLNSQKQQTDGMMVRILSFAAMMSSIPQASVKKFQLTLSVVSACVTDLALYLFAFILTHSVVELLT